MYEQQEWSSVPYSQKILYLLGPLFWGVLVWALYFGPGRITLTIGSFGFQLNLLLRIAIACPVIYIVFGNALRVAANKYIPTFMGYSLRLPTWSSIIAMIGVGTALSFFVVPLGSLLGTLLEGTLISACFEELAIRSTLIKFRMNLREFLAVNILSSITFALMHTFYQQTPTLGHALVTLQSEYGAVSYIALSFMFGILAYKTQRIEVAMIMHMLINFDYIIKTYLVDQGYTTTILQLALISFVVLVDRKNTRRTSELA